MWPMTVNHNAGVTGMLAQCPGAGFSMGDGPPCGAELFDLAHKHEGSGSEFVGFWYDEAQFLGDENDAEEIEVTEREELDAVEISTGRVLKNLEIKVEGLRKVQQRLDVEMRECNAEIEGLLQARSLVMNVAASTREALKTGSFKE